MEKYENKSHGIDLYLQLKRNYETSQEEFRKSLPLDGVVPWQYTSNSVVVVIVTCTFVCFNKKLATKWFLQNKLIKG